MIAPVFFLEENCWKDPAGSATCTSKPTIMITDPYTNTAEVGSTIEDVSFVEIEQSAHAPLKLRSISHTIPGLPRTWIMDEESPEMPLPLQPDRITKGDVEYPGAGFWNTVRPIDQTGNYKRFKSSRTWIDHRDNGLSGTELRELFLMVVFTYLLMLLLHVAYDFFREF